MSLRLDTEDSISCKINPDEDRTEEEMHHLRAFSRTVRESVELPLLLDKVAEMMGLRPSKAFSKGVLCVEICATHRPQLYVVLRSTSPPLCLSSGSHGASILGQYAAAQARARPVSQIQMEAGARALKTVGLSRQDFRPVAVASQGHVGELPAPRSDRSRR
jgi:hypothetical protein